MENDDKKITRDAHDEMLGNAFNGDVDPEVTAVMQDSLNLFRENLADHPYVAKLDRGRSSLFRSPIFRLAAAAALITLCVAGGLTLLFAPDSLTWAEVTERFRTVTAFNVTIYVKEDALSESMKMELWLNRDGDTRAFGDGELIFAKNGHIDRLFDVKKRTEIDLQNRHGMVMADFVEDVLNMLDPKWGFSLDTVVDTFSGELKDVTPLVNSEAVISEDMVVFDILSDSTSEWCRIWALRESKLPVRVRVWDPRDGEEVNAYFDFSPAQPAKFFDADAFADLLNDGDERKANLAYAFMSDPVGRRTKPKDLFVGYHMPTVKRVGITEDGAVWIVAENAKNRSPRGGTFEMFQHLKDDLGRQYVEARTTSDSNGKGVQLLIPVDYPFDDRRPGKLEFHCIESFHYIKDMEEDSRDLNVIGTVEITEWEENAQEPKQVRDADPIVSQAYRFMRSEDWEKTQLLIDMIPGEPETDKRALDREKVRLAMFVKRKQFDDAEQLADRIVPVLEERYFEQPDRGRVSAGTFNDYLVLLAATGRVEETRDMFIRLRDAEMVFKDEWNDRARRHMTERDEQQFESNFTHLLAQRLSNDARLPIDKVSYIVETDIKKDPRFKWFQTWDWDSRWSGPQYQSWREHLDEIAKLPLPEKAEIRHLDKAIEYIPYTDVIPGVDTHKATRFAGALKNWVHYSDVWPVGSARISPELGQTELSLEIVYEASVTRAERMTMLLDYLGMETVEATEPRTVWVAKYDGRTLRHYEEVKAPVEGDTSTPGAPRAWGMVSMGHLLKDIGRYQNEDVQARGIIVDDQTGINSTPEIPEDWASVAVSNEGPYWKGQESLDMARTWFKDQFGVTFTEETRPMTVHVVKKKTDI